MSYPFLIKINDTYFTSNKIIDHFFIKYYDKKNLSVYN